MNPQLGSENYYSRYYYFNFQTDINGDGLPDYVYVYHYPDSPSYYKMRDCVYLSNGQGWDLAYRCVVEPKSISGRGHPYRLVYYGDCAG